MSVKFEPKRLQQARSLRRMSLADVGEEVEVSRQALSQFERGDRTPSPETLEKIASALAFPIEFFWKGIGEIEGRTRSMIHYRSLRRTRDSILDKQRAAAAMDLSASVMDSLQQYVDYAPAFVPKIAEDVDPLQLTGEDVEEIANGVRLALGIGKGPISDMTLLVENQSIPVVHYPFPDGLDGLSAYYGDRPFIMVSSDASYARSRLNIAHEFGHLVLHEAISYVDEIDMETFKKVEDQAWRFAGALMLPAESFLSDVYSTTLDALVLLKKKWGVSIAAMVRRLRVLDVISAEQSKYLNIQIRQRGWAKKEPGDEVPREVSRLFGRAAEYLDSSGSLRLHELAMAAKLPLPIIAHALEVEQASLLPPRIENVVAFRPRS